MPLHDWSRVGDNVFHSFHGSWIHWLMGTLNQSVLPQGYLARSEEYAGPYETDILTLEVGSGEWTPERVRRVALEPTATIAPPRFEARRQRRLTLFSTMDERRVAVVEIVPPRNKISEARAGWFEAKLVNYLATGLHLLVIDLHPAIRAAPGIAAGIAQELGAAGTVPAGGRCTTSFERRTNPDEVRVYHQVLTLGQPLPQALLFLEPGLPVEVPLEETYLEALSWLPHRDQEQLASFG